MQKLLRQTRLQCTSNGSHKEYHASLYDIGVQYEIHTMYGPIGRVSNNGKNYVGGHDAMLKEFESIIRSKQRKGYTVIDDLRPNWNAGQSEPPPTPARDRHATIARQAALSAHWRAAAESSNPALHLSM